jgi:hypothetical protein
MMWSSYAVCCMGSLVVRCLVDIFSGGSLKNESKTARVAELLKSYEAISNL